LKSKQTFIIIVGVDAALSNEDETVVPIQKKKLNFHSKSIIDQNQLENLVEP
jgi:hypothetical protein